MTFLAQIISWINVPTNTVGTFLLSPVALMPGWLSITVISAATGMFLLVVFKYMSNQKAIGKVRDQIKANMLVLKLFKDNIAVILQAQGRIFKGALLLLIHSIKPILIMIVPLCLLLSQMGLWYQHRPLKSGEETMVMVKLGGKLHDSWPNIDMVTTPAVDIILGPVKILSKREVDWKIKAHDSGIHRLVFLIDDQQIEKELAIGDGFMRVSPTRPGWHWMDIAMNPREKPFDAKDVIQSIRIEFPERVSKTSGANWWVVYFFAVSMITALLFKPVFKVRI